MDRLGPRVDRDVVSGAGLLVAAVIYLIGSRGLPAATDAAEPGPAFFPRLVGVALVGLALAILVGGVRRSSPGTAETVAGPVIRPLVLIGATIAYVLSFEWVGFLPSTLVYTWIVTVLFRSRPGWHWLFVPALTTAFVYALFGRGLGVILPGME